MKPGDIAAYSTVGDPQMHPDGVRAVFVVSRANLDDDRYDSSIWMWDGEMSRQFTSGVKDSRSRWSPDGESLAFIRGSTEKGVGSQLAVMAASGGEASVTTDFEVGVTEAEWSPDGSMVAIIGTNWTEQWSGLDDEERGRRPRRITGPEWRFESNGFLHDKTTAVHLLSVADGSIRQVSPEGWRPSGVTWRPDGRAVGFMADGHDNAGFDGAGQAWEVVVDNGEPEPLVDVGGWGSVTYRPDGAVHVLGTADVGDRPGPSRLYRVTDVGLVRLGTRIDSDVVMPQGGFVWLADGTCRALVEDAGRLVAVDLAPDGSHSQVLGGERYVTAVTGGDSMIAAISAPTDPGELVQVTGGAERVITHFNTEFRDAAELAAPQHFEIERDGVELDVWVYLPHGDGPFPTLFNIHGGPMAQYGWSFFDEFQVEIGAGYAVVATNPRGASGKGDAFMKGEVGTWSMDEPPDALDLLGALDAALDRFPALDRARLGIMGGSYGGLITSKILSFDHRFKSAVPERGLYNFVSFAGTSDIGLWFDTMFLGERDYSDWSALWDASPLRTAHQITTPCLVVHSDSDHRCPIEQGEQLFALLLANGVETEFLRFPGEGHELSRSGSPKHRVERFDAVLEWHGRHI